MDKAKSKSKKLGRPEAEFDLSKVEVCGYFNATQETMAYILGCKENTIFRRMKDKDSEFYKAYKKGNCNMKLKLSEAQLKVAMKGNASMLIWLGKQYLNQKDNPMPDEDVNKNYTVILVPKKQAESDNN